MLPAAMSRAMAPGAGIADAGSDVAPVTMRFIQRTCDCSTGVGVALHAQLITRSLNDFNTFCRQQVIRAFIGSLNSKIMAITRPAGGSQNVGNFKDVLLFHCDGLRLCSDIPGRTLP